jgi:nitroreductase
MMPAPLLPLNPDELLTTTRTVRKRLDLERPVERGVIEECITVALQAPSSRNAQSWHFVVVTDADKRLALAELVRSTESRAPATYDAPDDVRAQRSAAMLSSSSYLRQHLHEVPVMIIPCCEGRVEGLSAKDQASWWGSILPASWSVMLALRARGLGSAWTTRHLYREQQAAELLGIPFDAVTQAGMLPVAYTKGTDFKPAARLPADQVTHWNGW